MSTVGRLRLTCLAKNDIFAHMYDNLNSLRMRAESAGRHISGAERLVSDSELESAAQEMLQRALKHSRGHAELISICVEGVAAESVKNGCLPDLHNNQVVNWQQGRDLAQQLLVSAGVATVAAESAIKMLQQGAAPDGGSMRGAMLVNADTGERLESDRTRGVRASRMDLTEDARDQLCSVLARYQLDNQHVVEAITLAAKVMTAPGIVAELCWSDDPDYIAGYVAADTLGYQRISQMKLSGDERGGRAFFVRCQSNELPKTIDWLENVPLLIGQIGKATLSNDREGHI